MSIVRELERRLAEREEDIIRRNEVIKYLEKELDERDATIRHLRNEIDMFRQVVRPITQHMVNQQLSVHGTNNNGDAEWDPTTRLRTKRQAISAEPIVAALGELTITRIHKTAK